MATIPPTAYRTLPGEYLCEGIPSWYTGDTFQHYATYGEECVCCKHQLEENERDIRDYNGDICTDPACNYTGQCGWCDHNYWSCYACSHRIDH